MSALAYSGSNGCLADAGKIGVLKALNLGGQIAYINGITEYFTDGSPAAPCMQIAIPNSFRFRWVIHTGVNTIQVNAKQVVNQNPRPSITVRANSSIGIPNDIIAYAPSGNGWTTTNTITINNTSGNKGAVYVDLANNYGGQSNTPAYFDHIVTS
jgi:hypothetical protein